MDTQEAYEKIRNWFSKPIHGFGYDIESDRCLYRAPNGDRCAIGCLIPDKEYRPKFDKVDDFGSGNQGNIMDATEVIERVPSLTNVDVEFLCDAQGIHDRFARDSSDDSRKRFIQRLDELALNYDLVVP